MILGSKPTSLTVNLVRDSDFMTTLQATGDFEPGTIIVLELKTATATHTHEALIEGNTATFIIDFVDVNELIDAGATGARLFYHLGDIDLLWARGTARNA